jgi:hypothetical protein
LEKALERIVAEFARQLGSIQFQLQAVVVHVVFIERKSRNPLSAGEEAF